MLRAIVAEDDALFRSLLLEQLQKIGGVVVEMWADNGQQVCEAIPRLNPDLVILDIGLPGMDGIEVAREIRNRSDDIEIIFITSYEEHIRDSVTVYAADYILKPLNENRLKQTLRRLMQRRNQSVKSIHLRDGDEFFFIKEKEIVLAEALGDRTKIVTETLEFEVDHSLKQIEAMLCPLSFFRSSRSYLVNLLKVGALKSVSRTSYEVSFYKKSCTALLSKKNYPDFRRRIKEINNPGKGE